MNTFVCAFGLGGGVGVVWGCFCLVGFCFGFFFLEKLGECGQQGESCRSSDYLEAAVPSGVMQGASMQSGMCYCLYLLEAVTNSF